MGLVDCHTSEIIVEIPQKKVLPCMDTVKIITRESDVTNTCYLISFSTTISVIYVWSSWRKTKKLLLFQVICSLRNRWFIIVQNTHLEQ